MKLKESTVREALLAELLGDIRHALDKIDELHTELEKVDGSAKATAQALNEANQQYRAQLDDLVAKLRFETSVMIIKTTEHAARTLVSQQTDVIQKSATIAIRQALSKEILQRTRNEWLMTVALSGFLGGAAASIIFGIVTWIRH
jgi:cell division septum initiation protein DivIVA